MTRVINWGIMGTGAISNLFATDMHYLKNSTIRAIGSRSTDGARRFSRKHNIERAYNSYSALADDPDIDVIYVATPHSEHRANVIRCLNAGKHVLCEKPFALNFEQAEEMVNVAHEKRLFLMEAMWTMFIPAFLKLKEILGANTIGDVRKMEATCGFVADTDRARYFDPMLGGGALLDIGIYPVTIAMMLFGAPQDIEVHASMHGSGVDDSISVILKYAYGAVANFYCSIVENQPNELLIEGSHGSITLQSPWWHSWGLELRTERHNEVLRVPIEGHGLQYEAKEVERLLLAGRLESDAVPHKDTLDNMRLLDRIREEMENGS